MKKNHKGWLYDKKNKKTNEPSKLGLSRKITKRYHIRFMCNINYTWILQLPHMDGFVEGPQTKNQTLSVSFLWLNHRNICSTGCDTKNFLFLDRPSSLQSFWLPVVMLFLPWISLSKRRQEISISFNFFLFEYTFSASSHFKNLTIVLSVFPSLWQTIIRNLSRLILICCKRCSMKFSRSFGATELGMPEKYKHSLLIYCSICDVVFQALRVCYS